MELSDILLPEWYLEAKAEGISDDSLRARACEFCLEALRQKAAHTGEAEPSVAPALMINLMLKMYAHAYSLKAAS